MKINEKIYILRVSSSDLRYTKAIEKLLLECEGYEPFLECSTPYFLAFSDSFHTQCIGFLSFLVNKAEKKDYAYEAEITCCVSCNFRRQGVFSSLFHTAQKYILSKYKQCTLTGVFPKYMRSCSLCQNTAYNEYLMILSGENAHTHIYNELCSYNNNLYESCFSDDKGDFLLYRNNEDEPCAVCSLDYCSTFTNLYGVYVDKEYRGSGLGTLLISQLICAYFAQSSLPLILNVRSTNIAALRLYQHCGFEIQSSVEFCYFTVSQL